MQRLSQLGATRIPVLRGDSPERPVFAKEIDCAPVGDTGHGETGYNRCRVKCFRLNACSLGMQEVREAHSRARSRHATRATQQPFPPRPPGYKDCTG